MIAQVNTEKRRARFLKACGGKAYFGCVLPAHLALFGKCQPGRFFAGPTLAVDLGGSAASVAGHCDPEELASFLRLCGKRAMMGDGPAPAGWHLERMHHVFTLAPGGALPLPDADETMWAHLRLNRSPSPRAVADRLFWDRPARQDDFYSELCTKRNRGAARVWTLEQGERIACTVGAYALYRGQAYMACGETEESLRGRGIGGRLIVQMANELAAEGFCVTLLCADERVRFYTRLGFAPAGQVARYADAPQ